MRGLVMLTIVKKSISTIFAERWSEVEPSSMHASLSLPPQ